ncbi:MAG: dicarboxylate/amino acid:cation symporter, partial [Candidatus Electrothrix sp. AUS4]|nr:dicarboxylate/amino acid:cation symporter [Candidatus Electrothrix sp. AUS4]
MESKKNFVPAYILGAIILAIVFALAFPRMAVRFHIGGEVFLKLLKMLVVPLVMSSVMSAILELGDIRKLGRSGGATVSYYVLTSAVAALIGLVFVNIIQPGSGTIDQQTLDTLAAQSTTGQYNDAGIGAILKNLILMFLTDNLFSSAANTDLLPLIVFSIIFAGILTTMSSRVETVTSTITQINDALISFVLLLMKFAPIGIFCLVASRFGEAQAEGELFEVIHQVGKYTLTVLIGLGFHAFVTLSAIFYFFTRRNPIQFMCQMVPALLTAFSTASSSATLPVTMEAARDRANISRRSVDFVLPLGATINMDGTALYEAVAAIFIAQAIGFELTLSAQLTVAVTATLAAIGAAGIPEAGLVTMLIVLNAVGLPPEYIGLILSVDWLLDRFRTTVNVFGDAVGAAILEKTFPEAQAK